MLKYVTLLFVLVAIAAVWIVATYSVQIPIAEIPSPTSVESHIALSAPEVAQGESLIVELFGDITSLTLGSELIPSSQIGNRTVAVIGFDTRASTGTRTLAYTTPFGIRTAKFHVVEKVYPVTHIVIPPALASQGVTSADLAQSLAQSDNVTLEDILAVTTETYHVTEPFVEPTEYWEDVGGFGTVRQDRNGSIRHLGVDLDGKIGDPVRATGRGIVVYAGELENFGNSIVIDHGLGIFSIYLHLSAIQTEVNVLVSPEERIGSIGNTGAYTLAPHLHFSIKIRGTSVNPRTFIDMFETFFVTRD